MKLPSRQLRLRIVVRAARSIANGLGRFRTAESGATAIEYGIIAALVALGIVVGAQLTGNGLDRMFAIVGQTMLDATNAAENSTGN